MPGHVILSHGLHSGPTAAKVSAMAEVAQSLGWTTERPDYRDIDAGNDVREVDRRLQRLLDHAAVHSGSLVLAGSSMGAFISALASQQRACVGLMLVAPPVSLPGYSQALAAGVQPTLVIHGWQDDICAVGPVIAWTAQRRDRLIVVDDGHRLDAHVEFCAAELGRFLQGLA